MNRSCQRQTQVLDLQRISDGNRSQAIAIIKIIVADQACFRGALPAETIVYSRK
jgi:hypothetical protein